MKPDYGESHPPLVDDRLPVLLVILDGLGDRPQPALDNRTPAEAAHTPFLDALAGRGTTGIHLPFGPGVATSSELAHWALFGFQDHPFPGRAVLEALGHGITVPAGTVHMYAALRPSREADGRIWITGRATSEDSADSQELLKSLAGIDYDGFTFDLEWVMRGEAVLRISGPASPHVTDSDPFFPRRHPWLRPQPWIDAADSEASAATAHALETMLLDARRRLTDHPVNAARRRRGAPVLDTVTTKWTGVRRNLPSFRDRVGIDGAAVTSAPVYRGLATLLSMEIRDIAPQPGIAHDLTVRLRAASELIRDGAGFVHVHTKATDEAGHSKDPAAKRDVLEQLDAAFGETADLEESAIVAITGDHATPASHGLIHSGDPTPLLVAGPTVPADGAEEFGERAAASGALGRLAATDVLPTLLGFANRPSFMGTRATRHRTLALPDHVEAMPAVVRRNSP